MLSKVFFLFSFVICLQTATLSALSCYNYYKTSLKVEDLPKDTPKINCTSPQDTCEVRVVFLKNREQFLSVHLKCNTLKNCQGAGTGCNATNVNSYDNCGFCCQKDNCNAPHLATFSNGQGHSQVNKLLFLVAVFAAMWAFFS